MRYISLFSGIEAASAAWMPLGWECVALSEVDPYCNAVLEERVPGAPNVGDIREVDWSKYEGSADVVIGGSPCQSFSVAGRREGLKGESGLMLEYIRAVQGIRPACFVWENVPGALSGEGGEAFRCLLRAMDEIGYGMAWRVLDAQFFHLAQRRERVFLVGVLGSAARAAEVLFEPESLRWDTPPSKRKRQELAAAAGGCPLGCRTLLVRCGKPGGGKGALIQKEMASTLSTSNTQTLFQPSCFGLVGNIVGREPANGGNGIGWCSPDEEGMYTLTTTDRHAVVFAQNTRDEVRLVGGDGSIAGALAANTGAKQQSYLLERCAVCQYGDAAGALTARGDSSPCADRGPAVVAYKQNASEEARPVAGDGSIAGALVSDSRARQTILCMADDNANAAIDEDMAGSLKVGGAPPAVTNGYVVRRLTPLECERLQGFPDGWTAIEFRGKPASDARRYRALGNSMAVPVIRWIGERVERALSVDMEEA